MNYQELLDKAKKQLPEISAGDSRFDVPKVKGHIEGNKTVISNFLQIADAIGRDPRHFLKYVLKELASPGDLVKQAVILKTKVSASKINEKIEQYVKEFVICKECGKPDTKLIKEGAVEFIRCQACGAKHSVYSKN